MFNIQVELHRVIKVRKEFNVFYWCQIWSGIFFLFPVNAEVCLCSYNVTSLKASHAESLSNTVTRWTGSRTSDMTIRVRVFLIWSLTFTLALRFNPTYVGLFNPMQVPIFCSPSSEHLLVSGFSLQFLLKIKCKQIIKESLRAER